MSHFDFAICCQKLSFIAFLSILSSSAVASCCWEPPAQRYRQTILPRRMSSLQKTESHLQLDPSSCFFVVSEERERECRQGWGRWGGWPPRPARSPGWPCRTQAWRVPSFFWSWYLPPDEGGQRIEDLCRWKDGHCVAVQEELLRLTQNLLPGCLMTTGPRKMSFVKN